MPQLIRLTGKKRKSLPVPEWLSQPVSGEEAKARAKRYSEEMKMGSEGKIPAEPPLK
ncbi:MULTISPECIES: hypothetical protein [Enterobacterales]|uniref:hypothetical protein n=1 Tax=Enterobacterales TaxID=91347 RepID=UPI00195EBF85|nr:MULTISPECIES: hypothetical protein [Enterobacterales]MBM7233607.1 hypothetical protein [Enterobacter roggenkampii]MBT9184102.1 hypothetical protein [Pectobacterium punjabense]